MHTLFYKYNLFWGFSLFFFLSAYSDYWKSTMSPELQSTVVSCNLVSFLFLGEL